MAVGTESIAARRTTLDFPSGYLGAYRWNAISWPAKVALLKDPLTQLAARAAGESANADSWMQLLIDADEAAKWLPAFLEDDTELPCMPDDI